VESAAPVLDPEARRRLLEIIEAGLHDRRNAWLLGPDGVYRARSASDDADEESTAAAGTFTTLCRRALRAASDAP
jgi:polyphosphate kinase